MMKIDDQQMLPIGTLLKLGEYRVMRYIASGGFGNTYEVEHVRLGKRLALKEFFMRGINMREGTRVSVSLEDNRQAFSQMREKFYKEAQRLARLEEQHIVEVTDFFEENATAYYVMKLIVGESLAAKMKRTGQPFWRKGGAEHLTTSAFSPENGTCTGHLPFGHQTWQYRAKWAGFLLAY